VNAPAPCLLLTADPGLATRLARTGPEHAELRTVSSRAELENCLERTGPVPILLDLRHADSAVVIAEATPDARAAMLAFGLPESDPFRTAREARVFAALALDGPSAEWCTALRHVLEIQALQEEIRLLRRQTAAEQVPPAVAPVTAVSDIETLYQFARASRHFRDAQRLLDHVVEGVAATCRVVRAGVFARLRDEPVYRLHAGLHCIESTSSQTFAPHDPFVRWIDRHAHLVSRVHLSFVADPHERLLLQRTLDALNAEAIVPLLGSNGLLGWIFVGHRATGLPFGPHDLADLAILGEHVATLLENALLAEEIANQKTLAENLLDTLPVGILAASEDGTVRWFNRAAESILGTPAAEIINCPVEKAGSRVADIIRRTLRGEPPATAVAWVHPATRRTLEASVHRVVRDGVRLGAMILLKDATTARQLKEQQQELERHAFWNDLAAAMSHEVRNPLVAISTFAQLLPERYGDAEFRQQFYAIVTGEVNRLNAIIGQINRFARPPTPAFRPVRPQQIVEMARDRAARLAPASSPTVACQCVDDMPAVLADANALADGLAHLLVNACEAVHDQPGAQVRLLVRRIGADGAGGTAFSVIDNGPGVPEAMRDKLFSPFGTTKPRGLGLGLPLARRTVIDHGGRIDVDSSPHGTTVTVTLPDRTEEHEPCPAS